MLCSASALPAYGIFIAATTIIGASAQRLASGRLVSVGSLNSRKEKGVEERREQFECSFCGRKFNFRKEAEEHEQRCRERKQ